MANEAVERFKELFAEAHEADDCHQVLECDPRTIIELETELRHLETELAHTRASLTADEGVGWRPIETAPKDGTRILAWGYLHDDGGPYYEDLRSFMGEMPSAMICAWEPEYGCWRDRQSGGSYDGITHWMPLPEPPAIAALQKGPPHEG